MNHRVKKIIWSVVALAVLCVAGFYWWFFLDNGSSAVSRYRIDVAELRQLADSLPGEKPTQLRYEHVFDAELAWALGISGGQWFKNMRFGFYSFQVTYPQSTVIVDTAQTRPAAEWVLSWDGAAFERVLTALGKASLIVVTHEHIDHIGGLFAYPDLKALLPALRLNDLQLAHPENMRPAVLDPAVFSGYRPLRYRGAFALAPGLVLLHAAGHTPGTQMVYVQLANGNEFLLIGDVAWSMRHIRAQRGRPRWMTRTFGEDRPAVQAQLDELHNLQTREPNVHLIPAHDSDVVNKLTASGVLQRGFSK